MPKIDVNEYKENIKEIYNIPGNIDVLEHYLSKVVENVNELESNIVLIDFYDGNDTYKATISDDDFAKLENADIIYDNITSSSGKIFYFKSTDERYHGTGYLYYRMAGSNKLETLRFYSGTTHTVEHNVSVLALKSSFAEEVSLESTYDVGDVVWNYNKLYKCITPVITPGPWDVISSHFTEVDASDMLNTSTPMVTIELSQVVSQDPLIIQLTQAQFDILDNNFIIKLDANDLGLGEVMVVRENANSNIYDKILSNSGILYEYEIDDTTLQAILTTRQVLMDYINADNVDSDTATSGQVLTADGSGNAYWAHPQSTGGGPVEEVNSLPQNPGDDAPQIVLYQGQYYILTKESE